MMKLPVLALFVALTAGASSLALAGSNPDFERDAKPILATQPGLVHLVHARYVVSETGIARIPGSAEQRPQPPFIFKARPRGVTGPFYLRLLIQPGPPGHVLKVADIRQLPPGQAEPSPAEVNPETAAESPASPPIGSSAPVSQPASTSSTPTQPTADTPSGPIRD